MDTAIQKLVGDDIITITFYIWSTIYNMELHDEVIFQ